MYNYVILGTKYVDYLLYPEKKEMKNNNRIPVILMWFSYFESFPFLLLQEQPLSLNVFYYLISIPM